MMQTIKQYYENEDNLKRILSSISNPALRVWKVQYDNRTFRQNDKRINSTKRLKELLFKNGIPDKVYASIGQFSNPQKFYGKRQKKAGYVIADANMLKSDLLFDCDSEKDLKIAHADGRMIIKFMKGEKDYKLRNIRMSGVKGFHLLYEDINPVKEPHPLLRINKTEDKRRSLVNRIPKLKTIDELHKGIICDQTRVHAALNTVKGKTGNLVKEIPLKDFMSLSTSNLMTKYVEMVVRPLKKRPMIVDESILTSIPGKERATISSKGKLGKQSARNCFPHYFYFVDNRVKGVKDMYITVLKFRNHKDDLIKGIQKEFNLSDFYKLGYNNMFIYINFKLLSFARLKKIMRYADPINLSSFLYYGHTWIPLTETVNRNGHVICSRPLLVNTIKSKYGLNDAHSRPHANLFNVKLKNMAGHEKNKVCKAIITERK